MDRLNHSGTGGVFLAAATLIGTTPVGAFWGECDDRAGLAAAERSEVQAEVGAFVTDWADPRPR